MKNLLFLATTFLMFVSSSYAQKPQQREQRERPTPEKQAENSVKRLNEELKLTEKQQTELKTFFFSSFKKRNEIFEKNKDNREKLRSEMQKQREVTTTEMKKILTPEQYKIYQANQEKAQQNKGQRPGEGQQRPQRQGGGGYPRR